MMNLVYTDVSTRSCGLLIRKLLGLTNTSVGWFRATEATAYECRDAYCQEFSRASSGLLEPAPDEVWVVPRGYSTNSYLVSAVTVATLS